MKKQGGTYQKWSRRMVLAVATSLGLIAGSGAGSARAAPKDLSAQDLLRKLEERDRKIAERDALIEALTKRVDQLEQRVGVGEPRPGETQVAEPTRPAPATMPPQAQAGQKPAPAGTAPAAPGTFEVDEEAAERALDRTLTLGGALLLPFGQAEFQPFFGYTRRENNFPVIVSDSLGRIAATQGSVQRNNFNIGLFSRWGLPFDSQLELSTSGIITEQSVVRPEGGNQLRQTKDTGASFGDVRVGLAKTLLHEGDWLPDVIARVTWDTDTGRLVDNGVPLGQGYNELRGSATFVKRQDPLAFTGSFFYESTLGGKNGVRPGDAYAFTVGVLLAASPETSLFMQLDQTFSDKTTFNGRTVSGSDTVGSVLSFGASSLLSKRILATISAGIGLTAGAPDYVVNLAFPIRVDLPIRTGDL